MNEPTNAELFQIMEEYMSGKNHVTFDDFADCITLVYKRGLFNNNTLSAKSALPYPGRVYNHVDRIRRAHE
jgi:hypothetical protein